jgi:putative ATPase
VLFIDEVHRFNKAQQDAFLPYIEDGTILFVGATTENPSFELNNALLSRTRTYVLKPISAEDIESVVRRALADEEYGLGKLALSIDQDALEILSQAADGDARRALTYLEIISDLVEEKRIDAVLVGEIAQQGPRRFDKGGDVFYEQISALHKSVRGSDPDAALYWFCRMIDGGCDPIYIARRVGRARARARRGLSRLCR